MTEAGHEDFTLVHYRDTLACALERDYLFVTFRDLDEYRSGTRRACVLRHDCDNDLVAADRMADVEQAEGVASTYCVMLTSCMYNALAPTNSRLVHAILDRGHHLGLHFDELAYPGVPAGSVADLVDREAEMLSRHFGAEVEAVSFHQPSPAVLDNTIATSMPNGYDRVDMDGYHYLSDSNTVWREGCACEVFREARYDRLQLLIHPEWWTAAPMALEDKWNAMFTDNFELCQDSMLERERAYHRRQSIGFRPADES